MQFRKPTPEAIATFIRSQHGAPLSYDFATRTQTIPQAKTPPGFVFDHRREIIGSRPEQWERAKEAVRQWVMFNNGWTEMFAPDGPPQMFRFRGEVQRIAWHWGPERIETGWWRGTSVQRDYYRVETETGLRYWLFRERTGPRKWHLQGAFT